STSYKNSCLYNTTLTVVLCLLFAAWAKVDMTMEESVEVYLGDSAGIPCQYVFSEQPRAFMIQWFVRNPSSSSRERIYYGDNAQQIVDNGTDFTGRITVSDVGDKEGVLLTIQDVQLTDEREFFCQVNGMAAGNGEGKTHLRVFDPPMSPVIEGVHAGISVTNELPSRIASCEARNGFPRPNITWYRDISPLTPTHGQINVVILVTRESSGFYTVQSELQYKVAKEDKDVLFSCEVSYYVPGAVRTAESKGINITVHYPTTVVELWKESPQGLVKEGDTVEIRCQGDGNPPPPFTFNREQASDDTLVLREVTRGDSGVYQCRSLDLDTYEEVMGDMQLIVHYLDPALVVPKDQLSALNATHSGLSHVFFCVKNEQQVGTGHMLFLQDATYDTAGEYVCEVTVPSLPGLHTSGSVHIIVQGAPQMKDADREVEMEEGAGKWVNLSCEAHAHPLPTISWTVTGSQVKQGSWREVLTSATEHSTISLLSVKVTSDITAFCNATNEMGTEAKANLTSFSPYLRIPTATEGNGVIIMVVILCILLLAILGSVLYFLHMKGKIPCGRSGKQEITKENPNKDGIVVEMKTDTKTAESVLLKGVNGDKNGPSDQVTMNMKAIR
uniref:Melanoma cell adhesion molecule a n=1 Tax=Hucho hucho TaxID=62062 RepID=A0A4W5JSE5_9TELE